MKHMAMWLAVAAVLATGGCSKGPAGPPPKLDYVNPVAHFAMNLPKGWVVEEIAAQNAVLAKAPNNAEGASLANIGVVFPPTPLGATLDFESVIAGAKEAAQEFPQYKLISEERVTLADGAKAWAITFQAKPNPGGPVIQQRQVFTVINNRCYTLGATALPDNFAAMEPSFDICFKSFRASW
jgi:hypothetical protein